MAAPLILAGSQLPIGIVECAQETDGMECTIGFNDSNPRLCPNLVDGVCQVLLQFGPDGIARGEPWQSFALRGWTVTQAPVRQDRHEVRGSDARSVPASIFEQIQCKVFWRCIFLHLVDGRLIAFARKTPCFGSMLINECIFVTA